MGGGLVTMPLMLDDQTKARSRKSPVQTKIVGELNEVEILETCFGVSAKDSKQKLDYVVSVFVLLFCV